MDFEKIKDFILGKKGLVIGIIATILIGGYFIQKNNQPVVNNNQVLSENNKNQSTDFSKNKSNNTNRILNIFFMSIISLPLLKKVNYR